MTKEQMPQAWYNQSHQQPHQVKGNRLQNPGGSSPRLDITNDVLFQPANAYCLLPLKIREEPEFSPGPVSDKTHNPDID